MQDGRTKKTASASFWVRCLTCLAVLMLGAGVARGTVAGNFGITHTYVAIGEITDPGAILVSIEPEEAIQAGAAWRLDGGSSYRYSGSQLGGLAPGDYVVDLPQMNDFLPTTSHVVKILGGKLLNISFRYLLPDDDEDGDGATNLEEAIAGTALDDPADYLRVDSMTRTGSTFDATVAGKKDRVYSLEVCLDLATGSWTPVATAGPLGGDDEVVLTDPTALHDTAYYRIAVSLSP